MQRSDGVEHLVLRVRVRARLGRPVRNLNANSASATFMMLPSSGTVAPFCEHAIRQQRPGERTIDADVLLTARRSWRRSSSRRPPDPNNSDDLALRRVAGGAIDRAAVRRQLVDARALLPVAARGSRPRRPCPCVISTFLEASRRADGSLRRRAPSCRRAAPASRARSAGARASSRDSRRRWRRRLQVWSVASTSTGDGAAVRAGLGGAAAIAAEDATERGVERSAPSRSDRDRRRSRGSAPEFCRRTP